MEKNYYIFTDGGARGNPGPAAIGFVIKDTTGKILYSLGKSIGKTTNNVAEYTAVIEALKWIKENPAIFNFKFLIFNFYLDSQLVVNQLNGLYKIKDHKLRLLIIKVKTIEQQTNGKIFYRKILRANNQIADSLVNQTLDQKNQLSR